MLLRTLHCLVRAHPSVVIRVLVDDISGQVVAAKREAIRSMVRFVLAARAILEGELLLKVSLTKTVLLSSDPACARVVTKALPGFGYKAVGAAKQLGVDYAAGARRSTKTARARHADVARKDALSS